MSDRSAEYEVTFFGTVHLPGCGAHRGMRWSWEGRNNLQGDTACPVCLPDGLPPENPPHKFTDEERARFVQILAQSDEASDD